MWHVWKYKDRSYEEDDTRTDIAYGKTSEREYGIDCNPFWMSLYTFCHPVTISRLPRNEMHCRMQNGSILSQWTKTTAKTQNFQIRSQTRIIQLLLLRKAIIHYRGTSIIQTCFSGHGFSWILFSHILLSAANRQSIQWNSDANWICFTSKQKSVSVS